MKFIPAFLFLGFFSVLAYFVWTDQIPYYLLPEDPADPNRLERAQRLVNQGIGYLGSLKTGAAACRRRSTWYGSTGPARR